MFFIYKAVNYIVEILRVLIFLRILLSWLAPNSRNEFVELVYTITEPLLKPFRVIIPLGGAALDLSPIIAYYMLGLARTLIFMLLGTLLG